MPIIGADNLFLVRYPVPSTGDGMDKALWLKTALERSGMKQAELARRLTQQTGKKYHPTMVNKMLTGERDIRFDEIVSLSLIFGIDTPTPSTRKTVRVIGLVTAGASAHLWGKAQDMFEEIDAPPQSTPSTVAVRVVGDSMYGLADDGSHIYYDDVREAPTDDQLNKLCVVGLADERVVVKRLKRGTEPGRFTLQSLNAPDIENVEVMWAARVTWIRPA